ncbi:MAG: extracellular solute-binding protein [Clostridiaceae bacterium]|nr:extracellular solute-binding protein [Clostridiaceae bacterium]
MILVSCKSVDRIKPVSLADETEVSSKINLRFISSWGGVDTKSDPLQQVLNGFMEDNPDIEVINESMYGEDFLHKLKTDFASGYNPDVFGLWPGSDIRALVKAGKVADITYLLEEDKEWKDTFGESEWQFTTYDDRIYGLPLEIIYECLFINRDMFVKYNVKVPRTYGDLKQAVIDFRKNGVIPIAYNSTAEGTYLYQNIVARLGGRENVENPFINGSPNKCYVEAMEYVKELYQMEAFPADAFKISSRERDELFINKKAAMIVQGSWFLGRFPDGDTTVDIVPFPYIREGVTSESALIYGFGCGSFHMSKSASEDGARKNASIKLLKALTSKESAEIFAKRTGMLSNVDSERLNTYQGRLRVNEKALLNAADELIGPPDSFVDRSIWEGTIVEEFPYVLVGEKTPEQVWDQVKEEYRAKGLE